MQTISWYHPCHICHRPIQRGRPMLLFTPDEASLAGISHSTCGWNQARYVNFQMCPPEYLSNEHLSFLTYFFHKIFFLPGGIEKNRELRLSLIELLRDYPVSLANPSNSLRVFLNEYKYQYYQQVYEGDLEADFLRILGQVQKSARENLIGVEIDFRKLTG